MKCCQMHEFLRVRMHKLAEIAATWKLCIVSVGRLNSIESINEFHANMLTERSE